VLRLVTTFHLTIVAFEVVSMCRKRSKSAAWSMASLFGYPLLYSSIYRVNCYCLATVASDDCILTDLYRPSEQHSLA
jgi:hypothetical protein